MITTNIERPQCLPAISQGHLNVAQLFQYKWDFKFSLFISVLSVYYVLQVGESFEAVSVVTVAIVSVCASLIAIAENVQAISKQVRRGAESGEA